MSIHIVKRRRKPFCGADQASCLGKDFVVFRSGQARSREVEGHSQRFVLAIAGLGCLLGIARRQQYAHIVGSAVFSAAAFVRRAPALRRSCGDAPRPRLRSPASSPLAVSWRALSADCRKAGRSGCGAWQGASWYRAHRREWAVFSSTSQRSRRNVVSPKLRAMEVKPAGPPNWQAQGWQPYCRCAGAWLRTILIQSCRLPDAFP